MAAWLTPSGGLAYHLRALRYRSTLWGPFRAAVADWLSQALPVAQELILVGPSAGHCLPLEQLGAFRRVLVLELDPLARWLLRQRLGRAQVEMVEHDLLVQPLLSGRRGLDEVLAERPGAALLFCNVLGQVPLSLSEAQQAQFRTAFQRRLLPALGGRRWASFHDRWSLDAPAVLPPPALVFAQAPSDDELAAACFGSTGPPLSVLDHGSAGLFPETGPHRYMIWQLTPAAVHVVEAVNG